MTKLSILLLFLTCYFQYNLWLGKNGIQDYIYIKNNVIHQRDLNTKLKIRNDRLFTEITDLNKNGEAIEERSRNELGMIKTGETFYRFILDKSK